MANSYASSATVRDMVFFLSSGHRAKILIVLAPEPTTTSAIHKEKFNVPLSGYEQDA